MQENSNKIVNVFVKKIYLALIMFLCNVPHYHLLHIYNERRHLD